MVVTLSCGMRKGIEFYNAETGSSLRPRRVAGLTLMRPVAVKVTSFKSSRRVHVNSDADAPVYFRFE